MSLILNINLYYYISSQCRRPQQTVHGSAIYRSLEGSRDPRLPTPIRPSRRFSLAASFRSLLPQSTRPRITMPI
jgi:hypothetical protein